MSCRQRTEYRCFTSSLTRQVGESEVATGGGIWVATGVIAALCNVPRAWGTSPIPLCFATVAVT
jgi:hypothetical protein